MPENEFELYLTLLSRFLRLKPSQHSEIADELRDHLEARLEDFTARGLPRDEAIRRALDEFGDAAELANHFTHLSRVRRRRIIMRFTFGTVAALTVALLTATAFWPEARQAPAPQRATAQTAGGAGAAATSAAGPTALNEGSEQSIDARLEKRIGKVKFTEVPLSDVLTRLSELIEADILLDAPALAELGLTTDALVNLQVQHANLTARVMLDLVLEPLNLSYAIRDDLIQITTAKRANQIQVYNVRDLVGANLEGGGAAGGANTAPQAPMPQRSAAGMAMGGMPMGGAFMGDGSMGGGFGGGGHFVRETNSLADLIAMTIDPASWDESGGHGSIMQYREFLIVKNSQTVQGKVKILLESLRTSAAGGAAGPVRGGAGAGGTARPAGAGSSKAVGH